MITDSHFSWICFQITHRILLIEDMTSLIVFNLWKSWENYATSFDAGLSYSIHSTNGVRNTSGFHGSLVAFRECEIGNIPYQRLAPGNPTLWRRVPVATIQKLSAGATQSKNILNLVVSRSNFALKFYHLSSTCCQLNHIKKRAR